MNITTWAQIETPFERFRQECEILSNLRHPNIIQYLGTHQDHATGLPVLLMELMDESRTRYLEDHQGDVYYHMQVDICNDIVLALAFLHNNNIIHRDLSSNNVLLSGLPGNIRAKVTDFGMARLVVGMEDDARRRSTEVFLSHCLLVQLSTCLPKLFKIIQSIPIRLTASRLEF